jgi:hypothetical protein
MKFRSIAALGAVLFLAFAGRAQTTAFTYQGQLNSSNAPANGLYDFSFQLFNAGSVAVSGPLTNAPTGVTNGAFTVALDFGGAVFDGGDRWLQIAVRAYGSTNAYTALAPLQQITSTPYAIRAINAANASNAVSLVAPLQGTNISGTIPVANLPSNVAFVNSNQVFSVSNTFNGVVTATNSANTISGTFSGTFSGNGPGLTNLAATSLTGTLPDARLSSNVALQSNPNLLFAGSVTATNFIGAGHGLTNVPGAFFWVTVSSGPAQSYPNVGYLCSNNITPVTILLPASPSIGDVIRVAGVGGAGWIVAQNPGQTILAGNLSDSIGQSWTARDSSRAWSSVASSVDGTKLAATVQGGQIYTSANSGATWTPQNSGVANWSSIASSADGTKLVAGAGTTTSLTGYLSTSTDSGATWTARDYPRQWVSVGSSADGTKLVAANYSTGGSGSPGIYTSANSGANWGLAASGSLVDGVASSASGTNLVATLNTGNIFTSTNSGAAWTSRDSARAWTAVASSADGTRLIAAVNNGQLYLSSNSGMTWAPVNPTALLSWTALVSSADGSRLVAAASSGQVYISTDSGASWNQNSGVPSSTAWSGAACSADGSMLVLVANGGQIYTSSQGGTTTGTAGYLSGARLTAIELNYTGNGIFIPLSHEGTIRAY